MKKLLFLSLFVSSSGFAQNIKRYFKVKDFERLEMGSAFIITVTQGNSYKVELTGPEKEVKEVIAKTNANTLELNYPSNWGNNKNRKEVYVNITMPKLAGVDFSGASKSTVRGFSSDKISIDISGASVANFNVNAKNLVLDCSGASTLKLVGTGQNLDADISGASNINALEYKVTTADIEASGASDVKVLVTEKIVADASGASTIRHKGGASVKSSTSGAGSVKTMN